MADPWTVRSITRALLPILLVLTVLEIVGGLTLDSYEMTLLQYPTLLVLVPVTIGTAGNLGSILAARLSTAFHLGTLSFAPDDETLLGSAAATLALAVTAFPLVGVGGWLLTWLTATPRLSVLAVLTVALTSGVLLAVLAVAVTVLAAALAYRFELDPDDVVIPVVTNVCDVLGVLVLLGVVEVLIR